MAEVSIVLPVFNPDPAYLGQLFGSITKQSFKDFDLVISDDADSEAMIFAWLPDSLKNRTTYLKNKGAKGIFGNLNNACRHATGKYLQIICQDDIMLEHLVEENQIHISDSCLLVFSDFDIISSDNTVIHHPSTVTQYLPNKIDARDASDYLLYFGCLPGNLSPVMFHRQLLDLAGYFDESYQYAGDYEYWVRASRYTSFYYTKDKHLLVRSHDSSASKALGPLRKYAELRPILTQLINRSSSRFNIIGLKQYIHIHLFRMVVIHSIIQIFKLKWPDIKLLVKIFDGQPFTISRAFISFLNPIPNVCKPLQQAMEVVRNPR